MHHSLLHNNIFIMKSPVYFPSSVLWSMLNHLRVKMHIFLRTAQFWNLNSSTPYEISEQYVRVIYDKFTLFRTIINHIYTLSKIYHFSKYKFIWKFMLETLTEWFVSNVGFWYYFINTHLYLKPQLLSLMNKLLFWYLTSTHIRRNDVCKWFSTHYKDGGI